jgi:TRAP-type uncharacterized transport system substrate-binding protein
MKASLCNTVSVLVLSLLSASALPPVCAEPADATDADRLVFSAGRKDSGYWGVASRLKKVAGAQGLKVDILESQGSVQNLERLDSKDSPANVGLSQADALNEYLSQHPAFAGKLTTLESIGLECVFLITSAKGNVVKEADLAAAKGFKIALPGPESGAAVTYRNLSKLYPAFANTQPAYLDPAAALQALSAQGDAKLDAVMTVLRPKERTPEIQQAIDRPDLYRFVEFANQNLSAKLPDGQPIYSFLDLPLVRKKVKVEKSLPTVCVNGVLLGANDKITTPARRSLEQIIDEQWMRIYSKDF